MKRSFLQTTMIGGRAEQPRAVCEASRGCCRGVSRR
jgi:hypothetical protein